MTKLSVRVRDFEFEGTITHPEWERLADEIAALEQRLEAAERDAERFRFLTADLAGLMNKRKNAILERMVVMSYSATCELINAAMKESDK